MVTSSDVKNRLGGRHAISLPVFLMGSPFWILGWVLNEPATYQSVASATLMLALSLLGQIAMGLVLLLAHVTVGRSRERTPMALWVVFTVWSLAAIARMAVVVTGMDSLGLENALAIEIRLATAILMSCAGYAVGAWGMEAFDRFSLERAALLTRLLSEEEHLQRHRSAIDGMTQALVAQVDREIQDSQEQSLAALSKVEEALDSNQATSRALDELRRLSDATWQRVGQELWPRGPMSPPRIRVREILTLWARSNPFSIPLLALLGVFLYLLIYSRVFDPLFGVVAAAGWLGLAVFFSLVANETLARTKKGAAALGVVLTLLLSLSSIPLLEGAAALGYTTEWTIRIISVHFISVLLLVGATLPPAVASARQDVLDNLRSHLDARSLEKLHVESQLAVVSQKIANHLHGDVRGNFLAAVLTLQSHLDSGNIERARRAIADIKTLLGESVSSSASALSTTAELAAFIENWSGLVDIQLNQPLSDIPAVYQEAAHTIIVEAINNAVRHGGADWVRINTTVEADGLVLSIRNNGAGLSGSREGLGTANLNLYAPDSWTRIAQAEGITQLLVRLERTRVTSLLPHL